MGTKFTKDGFINDNGSRPFINGVDSNLKLLNLNQAEVSDTISNWTNNGFGRTTDNNNLRVLRSYKWKESSYEDRRMFGIKYSVSGTPWKLKTLYSVSETNNFYFKNNSMVTTVGTASSKEAIKRIWVPNYKANDEIYNSSTLGMAKIKMPIATNATSILGTAPDVIHANSAGGGGTDGILNPEVTRGFGCWIIYYYDSKIYYIRLAESNEHPDISNVRQWLGIELTAGMSKADALSFQGTIIVQSGSVGNQPLAFALTANGGDAGTAYLYDRGTTNAPYYIEKGGGAGACAFGVIDPVTAAKDDHVFVFCSFTDIPYPGSYEINMLTNGITALYELDVYNFAFGAGAHPDQFDEIEEFHKRIAKNTNEVITIWGIQNEGQSTSVTNGLIVALESGETGNCENRHPVLASKANPKYIPKGGSFTLGYEIPLEYKSGSGYGYSQGKNYSVQVLKGNDARYPNISSPPYKICFGGASKTIETDTINICKTIEYSADMRDNTNNMWGHSCSDFNYYNQDARIGGASPFAKPSLKSFADEAKDYVASRPYIGYYAYPVEHSTTEGYDNYGFGGCAVSGSTTDVRGRANSVGGLAALVFLEWHELIADNKSSTL